MADLIDVKEALGMLGCDERTLTGYITSGAIRAQKVGGKLMVDRADVDKVAGGGGDEDVNIVLTGDSDNLSVDLGKVDESTMTTGVKSGKKTTTDSITFAEEMEVVNLDQSSQTQATAAAPGMDLGFTENNTAVVETVGEGLTGAQTVVGTTDGEDGDAVPASDTLSSGRGRSNRSHQMDYIEVEPPPVWVGLSLAAGLAFLALGTLPYFFLAGWPSDDKDSAKNVKRGTIDGVWSSLAGLIPGSVSPDPKDRESIKEADTQATMRSEDFKRAYSSDAGDTWNNFLIVSISEDGRTATAKGGKTYPIVQQKTTIAEQEVTEEVVDIGLAK